MISNDINGYIREDVFNARMDRFEAIIDKNMAIIDTKFAEVNRQFAEVRAEIKVLDTRISNLDSRIDDLKTFMSVGFCIIAIVVALVPYFNYRRKENKKQNNFTTVEKVQDMINQAMTKSNAVLGK